jgi:hypothetical protein
MNTDLLNLLLSYLPGYEKIVIAIVLLALSWNPVKGALQDIPAALGWRSNSAKRRMQMEDLNLITEQLKDTSLSDDDRKLLSLRRTELLLSSVRGVEFPARLVNEVVNISTDKQPDGLSWQHIRIVRERMEWEQGRFKIDVPLSEKTGAVSNAVFALFFFLFFVLVLYTVFTSPFGTFTDEVLTQMILRSSFGAILGLIFIRSSLRTYDVLLASKMLNDLHLRLNPQVQPKNIEAGTAPENLPIPQE